MLKNYTFIEVCKSLDYKVKKKYVCFIISPFKYHIESIKTSKLAIFRKIDALKSLPKVIYVMFSIKISVISVF